MGLSHPYWASSLSQPYTAINSLWREEVHAKSNCELVVVTCVQIPSKTISIEFTDYREMDARDERPNQSWGYEQWPERVDSTR